MLTIALSHLLGRGVRLETHEAVALARGLLRNPCGIPTPGNIELRSDGSASCISTNGALTAASIADLLLILLPAGTPNVPAPLRYALARAVQVVEAPPFTSLEEFSTVLERFEKGPTREVLAALVRRGARPGARVAAAQVVARPTLVPPRPTLVVRNSQPPAREPFGPVAVMPVPSAQRWATAAAAALIGSFVVGFSVMHGVIERRAATHPAAPTSASSEVQAASPPANEPAAKPAEVEVHDHPAEAPTLEQVTAIKAVDGNNAGAFSPAFASDGTAIFFHTGRARDARSDLEVATAGTGIGGDLGIMTIVDDGSRNYHAQPSPDGRMVAFDSDRDGQRGIYVANRDGSEVRRVSGPGYAAVPTWSHNGEWLAYIRAETAKPSVWNLWVQPAAGGAARRVTNYRSGQTWAASWFPDNRRIAYSHEETLFVRDLQRGAANRYPTPVKGQLVRTPAVSPDGSKIIFQVFRHGAWLLDLRDGSMRCVLTDPTAEEFAWAPDGRRVAFHSRRDGQWGIYVLWR